MPDAHSRTSEAASSGIHAPPIFGNVGKTSPACVPAMSPPHAIVAVAITTVTTNAR